MMSSGGGVPPRQMLKTFWFFEQPFFFWWGRFSHFLFSTNKNSLKQVIYDPGSVQLLAPGKKKGGSRLPRKIVGINIDFFFNIFILYIFFFFSQKTPNFPPPPLGEKNLFSVFFPHPQKKNLYGRWGAGPPNPSRPAKCDLPGPGLQDEAQKKNPARIS